MNSESLMSEIDNVKPTQLHDIRLAQTAARDRNAAEHILRRLFPKIYQVVRATVSNKAHVEDVGQAAAVEVLQSLRNFKGQGTLEAWAGQIAFRTAVRSIRKQQDWNRRHTDFDTEWTASSLTPEAAVSRKQLFDILSDRTAHIPEKRRAPLLLHLVYGCTVREVSEILQTPENTIKDRLKTAVREFRTVLNENPGLQKALLEVIS